MRKSAEECGTSVTRPQTLVPQGFGGIFQRGAELRNTVYTTIGKACASVEINGNLTYTQRARKFSHFMFRSSAHTRKPLCRKALLRGAWFPQCSAVTHKRSKKRNYETIKSTASTRSMRSRRVPTLLRWQQGSASKIECTLKNSYSD